jgi:DNA-binding MarR family transcriptional regulator
MAEPVLEELETDTAFARPEESFGFRLWHVLHAWQRRAEAELTPFSLTFMQFVVLAITFWLDQLGERPSQSRIAGFGQIDRMTISNVLRLLEDKGYVLRRPHPCDPRANWVALTESGRVSILAAKRRMWETQTAFFGRLGPLGQQALAEQLDALLRFEKCNPGSDARSPVAAPQTDGP